MICGRCGRKLKDPVSIQVGYGPVCREEMGIKVESMQKKREKSGRRNSSELEISLDIPGQMSIYDNPEWLPKDMKGGGNHE